MLKLVSVTQNIDLATDEKLKLEDGQVLPNAYFLITERNLRSRLHYQFLSLLVACAACRQEGTRRCGEVVSWFLVSDFVLI